MGFFKWLSEGRERNIKRVRKLFEEERNMYLLDNISIKDVSGVEQEHKYDIYNTINLFDDRLRICGGNSLVKNDDKNTRNIFRKDIVRIRVMDERQIEEQSKLGQMMIIGVLALGTKKQTTTTVQRKIVLDICEEGIDFNIVFDVDDMRYKTLDLAKKINRWKKTGTWE